MFFSFFAAMGWGKELNNCLFNIYKRGFSGDKWLELFFFGGGLGAGDCFCCNGVELCMVYFSGGFLLYLLC